jgi:hypothetical protein
MLYAILAGCLLIFPGCGNDTKTPLREEILSLQQEQIQLMHEIKESKAETEELKKQIQVLSSLPPEAKFENLYRLQSVRITKHTNLYDKDKDGQYEKLIVYVQPIDETGDIIKAIGAVDVQLWDLNQEASQAMLGEWQVTASELKKLWYARFLSSNYRLTFDIADKIDNYEEPLTVKVTFTDYLTGKVFKEQIATEPR